ncbi:DUF6869 domain-containing protein [Xanthomonas citri]|uniref:DUF6869 domain-containing protein n=1 Tax=Xanthomonas citri TaxID=346 RepID=UPI002FC9E669
MELHSIEQEIDTDHPLCWAVERTFHGLRRDDAKYLWDFVLFVLGARPNERVLSCLAAGPLEDLIAYDGKYFIDRIELLVLHDPAFKHLIGGVWHHLTSGIGLSNVVALHGSFVQHSFQVDAASRVGPIRAVGHIWAIRFTAPRTVRNRKHSCASTFLPV